MNWTVVFPGQGSQAPGMGNFLYQNFKMAKETFAEASDAISLNLSQLCFEGDEKTLALTENTQPALLTVSVATERVLREEFGFGWSYAAGHSIGEYSALVAAGVFSFWDAARAVRRRGEAMQKAVPVGEGGMLAVLGLNDEQVEWLCGQAREATGKPMEPANYNSPGQVVISGSQRAVDWLKNEFDLATIPEPKGRAKLIPLQVSAPFHCSLMKPAELEMRKVLEAIEFKKAQFPIVQNFTGLSESNPEKLRENLIRQVSGPVRWTQSMTWLKTQGVSHIVEAGHGKVLSGLLKKIDSEAFKIFNVNSLEDLKVLSQLHQTQGRRDQI